MSRENIPQRQTITFFPPYHLEITPNDEFVYQIPVMVYVGGDGDVSVADVEGTVCTYYGLKAGSFVPIMASKVLATGTTATNLVGVFDK